MSQEKQNSKKVTFPWGDLRLPPFPQIALKIIKLLEDENAQLNVVGNLISSDQAFAAEVLIVANSLLYAPRYPLTSIAQAVTAIGVRRLQGLSMTVGVRSFVGKRMSDPAVKVMWHHNLATAIVSQQLATESAQINPEDAYTAGLLHDVGRMGLVLMMPKEYSAILNSHQGSSASIRPREWDLCGLDHCELGAKLTRSWNLPDEYAEIAKHHHEQRIDGQWDLLELLKTSCKLASSAGYPGFCGCRTDPYDQLLAEIPPIQLERFHATEAALSAELRSDINALASM